MKNIIVWLISLAMTCAIVVNAQQQIENKSLTISYNKTTSLIFPFSITSVDRGSQDVLAQKAQGVENVLQVKAARKDFPETNLTVITADGVLHQFTVGYSDKPTSQAINVAMVKEKLSMIQVKDAINERIIQSDSREVLKQAMKGKVDKDKKYQLTFALQDIFVHDNILYYRIAIRNKSAIDYEIKSLKFIIRDKKKVKRTSSQEVEVIPVYIGNQSEAIKGYASTTMIYALRKFTIPDGKGLHINLFEESGGRHFSLIIKNKDILKARMLPITKNVLTINN